MLPELDSHPAARVVLGPALEPPLSPSHAYLFHGPGGAGKRMAARAVAAELLATGSPDPEGARRRVRSDSHPDLTWVRPSGAHEILVGDIAEPVIASASKTPFEAERRVFVIEQVDELGEEAANRMLKTLEEPAPFVHLILLTSRLAEVLPTIRSRCQLVRFDAPSVDALVERLTAAGVSPGTAQACARLSLGDAERARELAQDQGAALRDAAEQLVRSALAGEAAERRPWQEILVAARARGEAVREDLEAQAGEELAVCAARDRKRVENEWSERIRRSRRRVETATLDLALQLVSLWLADLLALAVGAEDLVRNVDRAEQLATDPPVGPGALRKGVELVEETRLRFALNVSEDLACEALAYRLERTLST